MRVYGDLYVQVIEVKKRISLVVSVTREGCHFKSYFPIPINLEKPFSSCDKTKVKSKEMNVLATQQFNVCITHTRVTLSSLLEVSCH